MLASVLMQGGRVGEAVEELRRAAADSPRDAAIRHDLAIALFETGNPEGARAAMEEAMALEPKFREEYGRQLKEMIGN
jgi:Flp pilus assembly protein TadD